MSHDEVAQSRKAARSIRAYAAASFIAGWLIAIGAVVSWAVGATAFNQAADIALVIGLGGVVSGVAMYGSAWNLSLNATRLELQLRAETDAR